jgi:Flp pilus assembly protein TadG
MAGGRRMNGRAMATGQDNFGGGRRGLVARLAAFVRAFRSARDGSVAIAFGLSFIPLIIAVGVGIDLGRAYVAKNRLLHTADSAGLAIGAAYASGQDLNLVLSNYFTANFASDNLATVTSSAYSVNEAETVITVTAEAVVQTTFMKIAGINSVTVSASSQVTRSETGIEVVLVLDNSGSMAGSKLTSLKTASNSLVDILFGDDAAPTNLKIGLVPFSNNVNIGPSNTGYVTDTSIYDWGTTSWGGCTLANVTDDNDTKDDMTGGWTPFYWADDSNNNWYYSGGYHISSSATPNRYCPSQALTPLTNSKTTLTTAIDAMVAYGGTHINWGAIWGWRVISPSEPFTEGVAYGTEGWAKAVIILTDGANTAYSYVYDAFGYPSQGWLGVTSVSDVEDELDNRLATICTNMKAQDITVYTITFDLSDPTTQAIFEACATDSNKYYDSPTTAELERTFRAIAAELKKLRITG